MKPQVISYNRSKLFLFTLMVFFTPALCFAFGDEKADARDLSLHPHMQIVYQDLVQILNATSTDQDTKGPSERMKTESGLKSLANEAKVIHKIVIAGDKGHHYLSEELQRSSELAYVRYRLGFRDQAKFHVSEIVNACFGCHTSRESLTDSKFTTNFTKDLALENFDPLARARFLTLSRQFEASASEYERILKTNEVNADELMNFDPMVEYLILTLRVKNDQDRALNTLVTLQKNSYPEIVKQDIDLWVRALKSVPDFAKSMNGLEKGRALIASARNQMEFPQDRSGMVQYILASRYLQEYIRNEDISPVQKAQAYYELGGCELVLATTFSADEANIFFAEAIRLSPKTSLARKAFSRYEENLIHGYSGSSGLNLPEDEAKKLKDLKNLSF